MVESSNKLGELAKEVGVVKAAQSISNTSSGEQVSLDDVFMFFSLDLTNSTQFKNEYPKIWSRVIATFYDVVFEQYGVESYKSGNKRISGSENVNFWKFIGDEVLLYTRIYNYKEAYMLIQATEECIVRIPQLINQKLKQQDGCNEQCDSAQDETVQDEADCEYYINRSHSCMRREAICNSLGVKATLWVGLCNKNPPSARNIIYLSETDSGFGKTEKQDFLGPEIDQGFRISKYAVKNRVLISPFLADMLYSCGKTEDHDFAVIVQNNFKIISFQRLKGVWGDRPVPIIMYFSHFPQLYEYAEYDELELPVYNEIKALGLQNFLSDSRHSVERLQKILSDVHLEEEARNLVNRISDPQYTFKEEVELKKDNELHVACACFDSNGKLLAIQHGERGWEFGCTRIFQTNNWKDAIKKGYKNKYGLEIEVADNPIPVALYTYKKTCGSKSNMALGLIVLGTLSNKDHNTCYKVDFLEESELDNLKGNMVDNFIENAHKAFQVKKMNE